jgi:hypothetical protein
MKKAILLLLLPSLYLSGQSQPPVNRIDSIVNIIESKKSLSLNFVCDTSKLSYADLTTIECLKFYSVDNRLFKAVYLFEYYRKDSLLNNSSSHLDIYYYNNGLLIKVMSKDFDKSPPADLQFYMGEKEMKKYISGDTRRYDRFDGVNYFIETGYAFLEEFKLVNKK